MRAIKKPGAVLVANYACMLLVVQLLALTPAALAQHQPGETCIFNIAVQRVPQRAFKPSPADLPHESQRRATRPRRDRRHGACFPCARCSLQHARCRASRRGGGGGRRRRPQRALLLQASRGVARAARGSVNY
jgi:hypothetical protein